MKVFVDRNACQSLKRCVELCPEIFELDAEGKARAAREDVPAQLEGRVRQAAQACSAGAIQLDKHSFQQP
ncbi:MAG: ferredoxin [Chitinivibrionales bacterium]|nr:ferredoxin [Chitinivibrionales bacterium]MBD3396500.1 ferredoxin [Chitinivibrionales bacterium]